MRKNIILNKLKRGLKEIDPEIEIILFGSRARGDFKRGSDWDVLLLTNKNFGYDIRQKMRDVIFEIELESEEPISTLIYSKEEWNDLEVTPLHQIIEAEGEKI